MNTATFIMLNPFSYSYVTTYVAATSTYSYVVYHVLANYTTYDAYS